MEAGAPSDLLRCFSGLNDPRRHNVRHRFTDILTLALLAVMCRSDDWDEVVVWGQQNRRWLATVLELPNGIPSQDTFSRVFARIDPDAFERCFFEWTTSLASTSDGRLIAVDGKSLRGSYSHHWDEKMAHLVSAWCDQNQLVLGQLAADARSNEFTAIPRLLGLLDLKKAVVTIDAMGCQREIAAQVVRQEGDYILAVKDNHKSLHEKARGLMDDLALDRARGGDAGPCGYEERTDAGHGRIETRRVWVTSEVHLLGEELREQWPSVASLAMIEDRRQDLGDPDGKVSSERRCLISSLKAPTPRQAGGYVRHWGIENALHWRLDVCLGEDKSRVRVGNGAQNLSRLRRIALNKLKADPAKMSFKCKRYKCSMGRDYLLKMAQQ